MSRRLAAKACAITIVGASLSLFAGCGESPTSTSVPATTPTTTPAAVEYLDPQPVDLTAIVNLDLADLSDGERQVLAKQSFVAVGSPAGESAGKFWSIYEDARYRGLPVLVTTDSLLNAYHGLFDALLQRMEQTSFFGQVDKMSQELYSSMYDAWGTATDADVKTDLRLNMTYFAVASALLDPEASVPAEIKDGVEAELQLIEAAAGPAESPTLGYALDYSQFKPRGHYTRSEALQRYFKAMMWYGNVGFYINPRMPDITEEEATSLTRRAVLIAGAVVGPVRDAWDAVYEPTSFIVGESDDLTVDDVQSVTTSVFGTSAPGPDALADSAKIAQVQEQLNQLPAPLILSAVAPDLAAGTDAGTTREENQRSFRVMGQRFVPDSYMFQQLVWAKVGTEENKRTLPMGLDIMSVLGSTEAYRLETELYAQQKYAHWDTQLAKLKQEFTDPASDLWPADLYTAWLDSLTRVMTIPDEEAPAFMRSRPWALKSLNTALGSWTELRHDTILYAKQSVTAEGEGGEEPVSLGYVEPYPLFYDEIAMLAETMQGEMEAFDLLDEDSDERLTRMASLARSLSTISQKQLAGAELTEDEVYLIQTYGQQLESLEYFGVDEQGLTISPTPDKTPVVADVHTDYVTDPAQVLEEATGYPLTLYAAFELDGVIQLFVGASYSYYEFTAPVDRRLTDEEWTALLDSNSAPPRPEWTGAWIVQR